MFNRTFIVPQRETTFVPYEKTVTVKRAPTDESVILLKEFEKAALEKITGTYFIESSIAKGVVITSQENQTDLGKTFIIVFNINGEQHTVKHNFKRWEFMHSWDKDKPTPEVLFADTIREYLLREILADIKVTNFTP